MQDITVKDLADEARHFLDKHATRRDGSAIAEWGIGLDRLPLYDDPLEDAELLRRARQWRREKFDGGFGWIRGPVEYGGRGLTPDHQRAFEEMEKEYDLPKQMFFLISLGMVAPTILGAGNATTKDRYLRSLHRADLIGCQLFSEPGAGSDLASLATTARRDGDEWVVNGQKVWTTWGHHADIGLLLARTDLDQPKHKGITAFIVDMHAPGVEVRPLDQMNGASDFDEVFFTDVRIADDHRLGSVNDGWRVAMTTLMNERAFGMGEGFAPALPRLLQLVKQLGDRNDHRLRQAVADVVIHSRLIELYKQRILGSLRPGEVPGPELSINKLANALNGKRMAELAEAVLGARILADTEEWGTWAWSDLTLSSPRDRIAGGTDEVMRNILAERVLGLPKDAAIDTTTPFRKAVSPTER